MGQCFQIHFNFIQRCFHYFRYYHLIFYSFRFPGLSFHFNSSFSFYHLYQPYFIHRLTQSKINLFHPNLNYSFHLKSNHSICRNIHHLSFFYLLISCILLQIPLTMTKQILCQSVHPNLLNYTTLQLSLWKNRPNWVNNQDVIDNHPGPIQNLYSFSITSSQ